ncbi:MAG: hypothetical protein Q4C81_02640 [Kocuria sp.]|nr:hypothetical protein [Kocuria sp.]
MTTAKKPRSARGTRRATGGTPGGGGENNALFPRENYEWGGSETTDTDPEDPRAAQAQREARAEWLKAQRPPHWG